MFKGFRQIAFLTVVSRVFGMVRDMTFAYFFGRGGLMDIWTIAFKIPNLARRVFGEGAAASSLIPIYSEELKQNPANAATLGRTVATVIFTILAGVVLIGEIGLWWYCKYHVELESTRLMLMLTAVMLPYMCLICTVAILGGLLNSHRHFAAPAAAPIVLNLIIIASLFLTGRLLEMPREQMVFWVAGGVLLAGLMQILMQVIPLSRHGFTLKPAWDVRNEAFKKIMLLMGPMILGLTVTQLNTLADDLIAKNLSGSLEKGQTFVLFGRTIVYPVWDGAVSSLFYSQRLYQFPLGVLGISLATAIFPVLSAAAADKDEDLLNQTIRRAVAASVFVALPATVGLMLVSRPLIALLFQRGEFAVEDTRQVQVVLIFYAFGLCGYFLQQVVTRAFYSIKDSKWPARTAILAVLVNIVLNLTLIWSMGASGLAFATAVCSYLQVIILLVLLSRRFHFSIGKTSLTLLGKTVLATAVMALAGLGCVKLLSGLSLNWVNDLVRILVLVTICAGVYATASWLMGNPMLSLVFKAQKEKKIAN